MVGCGPTLCLAGTCNGEAGRAPLQRQQGFRVQNLGTGGQGQGWTQEGRGAGSSGGGEDEPRAVEGGVLAVAGEGACPSQVWAEPVACRSMA